MYLFFDKEKLTWNIPDEPPHADYYNSAHGYDLRHHNTTWKRLFGYAYTAKPDDGKS